MYEIPTKVYLDEMPVLHKAIETYLKGLDLDAWGSGADNWLSELACRRCDGFIPHSHNHGGFDVCNTHSSELNCYSPEECKDDCQCESDILLHGFRLMYEGQENGIHTICVYYAQWDSGDYYGINRAPTIAEIEIRFKTVNGLFTKLKRFINKTLKNN